MPPEHRAQLLSLLRYVPPNSTVSNLVTAHRDPSSGQLILGPPVLNRPWEWTENLGDYPVPDAKNNSNDGGRTRFTIQNSASLSLDLFNARVSGDAIISSGTSDDPRVEANIRSFEDGLSAESIFKRDWRETRSELDNDEGAVNLTVGGGTNKAEEVDEPSELPNFSSKQPLSSRRPSPASTLRSHRSSHPSAPSSALSSPLHPHPAHPLPLSRSSGSSAAEPIIIDVDAPISDSGVPSSAAISTAASGTRTSKRKIETDDDEVEIIENPVPSTSRAGKKPRGKTIAGKSTTQTTRTRKR